MVATIVVGTNSFVTESESLTILEEYVHAGAWATAINRVTSLITAFYDIDGFVLTDDKPIFDKLHQKAVVRYRSGGIRIADQFMNEGIKFF